MNTRERNARLNRWATGFVLLFWVVVGLAYLGEYLKG